MSGPSQYAGDWEDEGMYVVPFFKLRPRTRPEGCRCFELDFLETGCPTCCNCHDFYKDKPPCQIHTAGFLKTEEET